MVSFDVSSDVPRKHQGNTLDSENVVSVAEAGLQYYEKFLNEADTFFVHK